MKQKKYKGVYELINSNGLITGYYINYCGADGVSKKVRAAAGNPDDAATELSGVVAALNKARASDTKANTILKLGNGSLTAIADRYFATLKGADTVLPNGDVVDIGTAKKSKQRFNNYLGSVAAKKTVTPEQVKLIQKELNERDLSNKTINDATDLLRSILNFGVDNKYMNRDTWVMHKYKKLTVDNNMSVDAVLDPAQVREMFELSLLTKEQHKDPSEYYVPSFAKVRLRFFLKMLYFTGQRPHSILKLQKQDINADTITIAAVKKQGKHYVDIADTLAGDLAEWTDSLSPSDYLFGSEHDKSKPISYDSMSETGKFLFSLYNVSKTFKDNRDTWISFYVLRHSAATNVLAATGNMGAAQDLLNHSDPKITQRYAKLLKKDKKRAVNVL